jgi:hypothetical protein
LGSILLILWVVRAARGRKGGCHIPLDTDDKGEPGLSGDEESVVPLCGALGVNNVALGLDVLLVVLLGALEDGVALLLVGLRES